MSWYVNYIAIKKMAEKEEKDGREVGDPISTGPLNWAGYLPD